MANNDSFQEKAAQLFNLWQNSYAHTMDNPEKIEKTMEAFYTMQQECLKHAASNINESGTPPPVNGDSKPAEYGLHARLNELEARIRRLELRNARKKPRTGSK